MTNRYWVLGITFISIFSLDVAYARSKQLSLVTCENADRGREYSLYCAQDYSSSLGEFIGTYSCQIEGNAAIGEEGTNVSTTYTNLTSVSVDGSSFGSLQNSEVDNTLFLLRSLMVDKESQTISGTGRQQIEESVSEAKVTLTLNYSSPATPEKKEHFVVEGNRAAIPLECNYLE